MVKSLILCDCAGSQAVDAERIAQGCGTSCSRVHTELCGAELDQAARLIGQGDAVIACQQERATFEALAEELGVEAPGFVDLRDRAGWSDQGDRAGPKMAALAAEALLPAPITPAVDVISEGVCLIAGPGDVAFDLAARLCGTLAVTVLVTDAADLPARRDFDVIRGRVRQLSGALGGFALRLDGFRSVSPSGRGDFTLTEPRDGARSDCDIVIDLTGAAAMVPAPDKREGYLRADPRDPLAVARLANDAAQLVGTFEKPLYVRLDESLCAHSRAGQVGCTNCLDICPTGAIVPAGDHVAIDPMVCAGCGSCAALCPSTAITYEDPAISTLLRRMEVLSRTYRQAGGDAPRLLVHEAHGAEMIRLAARFGRGLPADVIPLELEVVSGFGHAEMLAGLAHGFARVDVVLAPTTERDALSRDLALAEAIAGPGRLGLIDEADPDALADLLYAADAPAPLAQPVLPLGNRRQVARLAAQALNPQAEAPLPLPEHAPYGAVLVDTDACTLCLSCVSLCPSGALMDNPDKPQLNFQEDACLQCGICRSVCPEDAIALEPRFDLSDAALGQRVLNEEEPFACVECGALFGVKSTVERIMDKLAGTHPAFASSEQARMIQMCDDCRVQAQFHSENNPFTGAPRPRPRTTEDYYSTRKDH
ncbi:4Fe-4S dicluster domain-containing protein [Cribrihabitans marinus]|uniref:4Fe-4S dicluster domain-containing protein n=1 Tax=Cribrihabitans marinus TaxID=1227549 RepID=A0A1H6ZG74_9RHOB|nr:4Fe-4S binding protein [Cribrihabitans marinus]GGH30940.1 4Fe-4S ferredoxin [Cribrihabitans marinus]SEJ51124.1 4Fe-4S dicluster domain-containing protein [Cribrihabitans marinus]